MSHHKLRRALAFTHKALLSLALLAVGPSLLAQSAGAASDETIGDTFAVSLTASGEFAETKTGPNPSISDNGRYVAFLSAAENLGQEPSGVKEAYVKDLHTGRLELVSRAAGTTGQAANEAVASVILSGDGRYAIFASTASNLLESPPAQGLHVYRRNLRTGELSLVDRVSGAGGAVVEGEATADAVSDDGRYVVFSADVEDLEDPGGAHASTADFTLYLRDMQTGATTVIGRASGTTGAIADEPSFASSISPEGRYVAFESAARNLVPGMASNATSQIYLRDLKTDTTVLISKGPPSEAAPDGEPGDGSSESGLLLGADGCRVAFDSAASNLLSIGNTPEIYVTNICSTPASTTLVSRTDGQEGIPSGEGNGVVPRISGVSADGRYILFSAMAELTGEASALSTHLYLRQLDTGQTTLVDRASGTPGEAANADPDGSAISANGCRIAFATDAGNLSDTEPPSGQRETYVHQLSPCEEEPAVAPTGLSFGAQALDTIGPAKLITVTAGSETLPIERVQPSGADAADFIVTADECSGETLQPAGLQPAGKCTLLVRFAPSATGARSASLVVHAAYVAGLEIALAGEGGQLPSGERGEPGSPGSPGATGSRGQSGKAGARGPAGRDAKVSCQLIRHRRKVSCSVGFGGKKAIGGTKAKLTRDGRTYASGSLAALRRTGTIRRGVYTLRLSVDGHLLSIPVRLS